MVRFFLMADAVSCALINQQTPSGYYNIQRMLRSVISKGSDVMTWGTCLNARGLRDLPVIEGVEVSNMAQLAEMIVQADKVLSFW